MQKIPKEVRAETTEEALDCYIHPNRVSLTRCKFCKRPICKECIGDTPYPHSCPSCYPKYYSEKMGKKTRSGELRMKLAVAIVVLLTLFAIAFPISYAYLWYRSEKEDKVIPPESRVYISSSDVYPVMDPDTNIVGSVAYYTFKIYLTNSYETDCKGLTLDILVQRNYTVIYEDNETGLTIPAGKTVVIEFSGIALTDGTYKINFFLWQKGMISVVTYVSYKLQGLLITQITLGNQDIRELHLDPGGVIEAPENPYDDYIWLAVLVEFVVISAAVLIAVVFIVFGKKKGDVS